MSKLNFHVGSVVTFLMFGYDNGCGNGNGYSKGYGYSDGHGNGIGSGWGGYYNYKDKKLIGDNKKGPSLVVRPLIIRS